MPLPLHKKTIIQAGRWPARQPFKRRVTRAKPSSTSETILRGSPSVTIIAIGSFML